MVPSGRREAHDACDRTSGLARRCRIGSKEIEMFFKRYALATILFGSLTAAATVPAAAGTHGALAAGFWKDDNGVLHVTSGTAKNYSSPGRAEDAAIDACFRDGRNCHVVSSFSNGGCGFISVGRNTHATRYGIGATPQRAFENCAKDGFDCNLPKGGCTNQYED
jgi:hypothetical protein